MTQAMKPQPPRKMATVYVGEKHLFLLMVPPCEGSSKLTLLLDLNDWQSVEGITGHAQLDSALPCGSRYLPT